MTRSGRQTPEPRQTEGAASLGALDVKRIAGRLREIYRPITQQNAPEMPQHLRALIQKLETAASD